MKEKLLRLSQQREKLVFTSQKQRETLHEVVDTWRSPLNMADKGLVMVRHALSHPVWIIGSGVALLTLLRPSQIGKWFRRGLFGWHLARNVYKKFRV
jgi:hypothetical protein